MRDLRFWGLALGSLWLVSGCSGKAIVDPSGGGGSGGGGTTSTASSSGTTTSTSSGTTTDVCDVAEQILADALKQAQACNPALDVDQCTGSVVGLDLCGCDVVLNDFLSTDEMADLAQAYNSWVDLGCGPIDCTACPPPPDTPWYCDPSSGSCLPAYEW